MARPSEGLTEIFVVRLEPETVAEIKRRARDEDRTQQQIIRRAIKIFLGQQKTVDATFQGVVNGFGSAN